MRFPRSSRPLLPGRRTTTSRSLVASGCSRDSRSRRTRLALGNSRPECLRIRSASASARRISRQAAFHARSGFCPPSAQVDVRHSDRFVSKPIRDALDRVQLERQAQQERLEPSAAASDGCSQRSLRNSSTLGSFLQGLASGSPPGLQHPRVVCLAPTSISTQTPASGSPGPEASPKIECRIGLNLGIGSDQRQAMNNCLRNQPPVQRFTVIRRKAGIVRGAVFVERERFETEPLPAADDVDMGRYRQARPPEPMLDCDLPSRQRAEIDRVGRVGAVLSRRVRQGGVIRRQLEEGAGV